jgi:hypothetical protein
MPKELTFALKLDPQGNSKVEESANRTSLQGGITARVPAPIKTSAAAVKAVEQAQRTELQRTEPQRETPEPHTDALNREVTFQTAPINPASSGPEAAAQPHLQPSKALEAAAIQTPTVDSPSNKTMGPLKELSVQVGPTQVDKVEVRMVDRAGEVQVAVRATNPDVAQGLRQGLSDLVDRLQQNGFRTEAWRPGGSVASVQSTGESRQKEMQFQRDGSQPQSGGSQQGRQQHSNGQTSRPKWVLELEGTLSRSDSTSGGSYGITS